MPNTNLTVTVDEDVLKKARIRAIEEDTSVNAVVREVLTAYAGVDEAAEARRAAKARFAALSDEHEAASEAGRRWSREQLYEPRLGRFRKRPVT